MLGHYLEAMGPFLNYYPHAVGSVITKLFELLTSLPIATQVWLSVILLYFSLINFLNYITLQLFWQDPATSASRYARLHICTSFVRLAKAANAQLLPHMKVTQLVSIIECCILFKTIIIFECHINKISRADLVNLLIFFLIFSHSIYCIIGHSRYSIISAKRRKIASWRA